MSCNSHQLHTWLPIANIDTTNKLVITKKDCRQFQRYCLSHMTFLKVDTCHFYWSQASHSRDYWLNVYGYWPKWHEVILWLYIVFTVRCLFVEVGLVEQPFSNVDTMQFTCIRHYTVLENFYPRFPVCNKLLRTPNATLIDLRHLPDSMVRREGSTFGQFGANGICCRCICGK